MFHRIPFRRPAGEMAHRDLQVESVRDFFLEQFLEVPGTIAVATTGIGQDQQFAPLSVMLLSVSKPPLPDGIDGELWRVGRDADMDESVIATHIVDTIRSRFVQGVLWEIVCIHFDRLSGPRSARVLEIADQLFVFRVDADHRQAAPEESLLLLLNIAELAVAIRMRRTRETFAVRLQAQSSFFNNRITDTCETSWPSFFIAAANLRLDRLTQRSAEDGSPAVSS